MMAIGPDLAPPPQSTIELPREGDRQPADAATESLPLLVRPSLRRASIRSLTESAVVASAVVRPFRQERLDDQVKVVALDREVNDLELGGVRALRLRLQHVADEVPHELTAKRRDVTTSPHRHVNGIAPLVLRPRAMRDVGPPKRARAPPPRPFPPATPRPRRLGDDGQLQLMRASTSQLPLPSCTHDGDDDSAV